MPATNQRFVKATLNLSPVIVLLVAQCLAIVNAMTGNAYFTTPSPTLAAVQAAIAALNLANIAALARTKGAAQNRDLLQKALLKLMGQLRDYVQATANSMPGQEEAVILSAKMGVVSWNPRKPRVFTAVFGAVSGSADLFAPRVAGRKSTFWEWSVDQKSWTDVPPTSKASTTIANLTPGTMYYFRYRVLTKDGLGDWSQVVSLLMR